MSDETAFSQIKAPGMAELGMRCGRLSQPQLWPLYLW